MIKNQPKTRFVLQNQGPLLCCIFGWLFILKMRNVVQKINNFNPLLIPLKCYRIWKWTLWLWRRWCSPRFNSVSYPWNSNPWTFPTIPYFSTYSRCGTGNRGRNRRRNIWRHGAGQKTSLCWWGYLVLNRSQWCQKCSLL